MKNTCLWIALALIWSSSYLAIKIGLESLGPLSLVALRMVIGTSALLVVMRLSGLSLPRQLRSWGILLVVGMFGNIIPFSLISFGEQHINSGLAALLMGIAPVVTVLLAPLVHTDESLSANKIAGIILGFIGLIVLIGPIALSGLGTHITGQTAVFCAALCYAFTTLYTRKFANLPALVMATGSMVIGTFIIVLVAVIFEAPQNVPFIFNRAFVAVIYLGLFPTALATLIYFYLVPKIGAARMSQVNFIVPIAGTFIGVIFWGEHLTLNMVTALGFILTAVFLVTYQRKERSAP